MKKTLVALAVAATTLVATSANAAVVYKDDATKVELNGSLRLALGKFGKDQRTDLRNTGSRVFINAEHNLGNGLYALGGYQLRFDKDVVTETKDNSSSNTFSDPTTRNLFAGFKYEPVGTLTFGKQDTTIDDFFDYVDDTYKFGGNEDKGTDDSDHATKSIKFHSADFNGFSFGLDYLFGDSSKKSTSADLKYGYAATLGYQSDLSAIAQDLKFTSALAYGEKHYDDTDATTSKTGSKSQYWRALAAFEYGPFAFGAEYGQLYVKETANGQHTTKGKGRYLEVGTHYQVAEPTKVYAQWQRNELRENNVENLYIVGADYQFNKNVITYVEYAHDRNKTYNDNAAPTKSNDNKYVVGLRVNF